MSKKIGRPTVRTPARAKIICNAIGRGLPFVHSCGVAQISFETFSRWRSSDEKFRAQIDEATAKGVSRRLKKIEDAAQTDWRAAAWLLERCPGAAEFYGRNRLEVTGASGLDGRIVVLVWPHQQTQNSTHENEKTLEATNHRLTDASLDTD